MKRLFLILSFILLPLSFADALTFYASSNGTVTNCTTMQTVNSGTSAGSVPGALACMVAGRGDTLYLRGGTYAPASQYANPPNGTAGAHTRIEAYPGETVTFKLVASSGTVIWNFYAGGFQYVDFIGGCTGITNRTCRMVWDGGGLPDQSGLQFGSVTPAQNIIFDGVRVTNWQNSNLVQVAADGTFVNVTFKNGRLDTDVGYAVYTNANVGLIVENNEIDHIDGYGIHTYHEGPTPIGSGGPNLYRYNYIHDTGLGAGGGGGGGATVNAILIGNDCANCEAVGNVIWNHNMVNNTGAAIRAARNANGTKIYNNTMYMSNRANPSDGRFDNCVSVGDFGAANTVVRNNICQNTPSPFLNTGTASTFSNNLCGPGTCNIGTGFTEGAATTFISPGSDFHLNAGSLAVNGGANLGSSYAADIAGATRPATGPWEIGAYEYGVPAVVIPQQVLALPLDEGTGTIAVDVSGQKNNATVVGPATWAAGVYGQAIQLDGTGYLNIPASPSLALAPGMTLEAWIYPTASPSGLTALIVHDKYVLYSASDPGYCPSPTLAPMGGYVSASSFRYVCATSLPPINQWSHLAITYDAATLTFYLNGKPIASQGNTDPMVPSSYNVTIGASQFGENFVGRIDQPMVYNYARTGPQINGDMSTPLIGAPGKYVEIAAPTSIEISSASTLEIGAD